MNLAPTILFVFNRPEHTKKTLESLMNNKLSSETSLYIFADGPRNDATENELKKIKETRDVLRNEKWCKEVIISENSTNKGLSSSIIEGVTSVINLHGKAIILEDDLITAPYFLQFMNDALDVYQNNDEVVCISGYVYPITKKLPNTFFIKGADCWGWATWKKKWELFEQDGNLLLNELERKNLTKEFDFDGSYPYTNMLREQIQGINNSWAIRWYASTFLKNKYCLYPGKSLVQNIGIDGSGTHSGTSDKWNVNLSTNQLNVLPIKVENNLTAKKLFINYFNSLRAKKISIIDKLLIKIKDFIS